MTQHTGRLAGALAVAVLLGACGGNKGAAADSAVSADTAVAATATPALSDTANTPKAAPAPVQKPKAERAAETKPKMAAPVAPKPSGEVASGTTIALHANATVCTDSNKVGDVVQATVVDPVAGSNGMNIPAGAVVSFKIMVLKRSENSKDPITMTFEPTSVEFTGHSYAMAGNVTDEKIDHILNQPTSKTVQKVAVGAVVGGIAGKLIGKSTKGAVIGAAAGAAAGAGVAATTANHEGCIQKGSEMKVKLTAPVKIS